MAGSTLSTIPSSDTFSLALSKGERMVTLSELLTYFRSSLKTPGNYPRIVKRYLLFVIEKGYSIDPVSHALYCADKKAWVRYPLNTFLKFAAAHSIRQVAADPPKQKKAPSANGYILAFLSDAKTLRGEHSSKTYNTGLNAFFSYLESFRLTYNGREVNRFVMHLKEIGLSAYTVNSYLCAIRRFSLWLLENKEKLKLNLEASAIDALRDVATVRSLPIEKGFAKLSLTEEQRELLFSHIGAERDRAMFSLMAYCGLRSVEVVRLQIKDVHLDSSTISILGKGRAVKQLIKLFEPAKSYLATYLSTLPKGAKGEGKLFPMINTRMLRHLGDRYFTLSGLKRKGVSLHSLRHTAASIMLSKGVEAIYVQRQLRHKDFSTTGLYVQAQIEKQFLTLMPEHI